MDDDAWQALLSLPPAINTTLADLSSNSTLLSATAPTYNRLTRPVTKTDVVRAVSLGLITNVSISNNMQTSTMSQMTAANFALSDAIDSKEAKYFSVMSSFFTTLLADDDDILKRVQQILLLSNHTTMILSANLQVILDLIASVFDANSRVLLPSDASSLDSNAVLAAYGASSLR